MTNQLNSVNIPSLQGKNIAFQQRIDYPNQSTPMQGSENLKETVSDSYLANRAKASQDADPRVTLGLTTGLWYAISQGMERFNKKMGGKWEDSILGKIGALGDKFSQKTFIGRGFENLCDWVSTKVNNLAPKSKIVYTLQNHSTRPEWKFAKMPGAGLLGFLSADAESVIDSFLKPIKNNVQRLEQYGLNQNEIEAFRAQLSGKPQLEQLLELQKKELELLGDTTYSTATADKLPEMQKLAEKLKIKEFGMKYADFKALQGNFLENPKEALKIFDTVATNHPDWKISNWRSSGNVFGKMKSHFFGRTVGFSEYRNKFLTVLGQGNSTRIGRALPKMFGWLLEGGTNRFAGGKLAVLMQASIFADMLYHTFTAPKGEKGKTLAERAVNDFTYFIGATIGIIGMHKIGGFKYAGTDKAGVEAFRAAREKFNFEVGTGKYDGDKVAYKQARQQLMDKLGYKNIKNPITKLLNRLGRFINMGNESIAHYRSTSKINANWLRALGNANIIGVPLRILIPLALVVPKLVQLTVKTTHKIFGKPTNSVLDEGEEESSDKNQAQAQSPELSNQTFGQNTNPQQNVNTSDTNLIKQATQRKNNTQPAQKDNNAQVTQKEDNKQTTDSAKSKDNNTELEPARTYIPNPQGFVQQENTDTSSIDAALMNADNVEKEITELLNSQKLM